MTIKQALDNSASIVYGTVAVIAFASGWAAHQGILATAGHTTTLVEQAKLLDTYEEERNQLLAQSRGQQSRLADLTAEVSQLKRAASSPLSDELHFMKNRVTQLEANLATAEDRAQKLARVADLSQKENERLELQLAKLQEQAITHGSAPIPLQPQPESVAATLTPALESAPAGIISVPLGKVVRITEQLSIALSATSRDGDGRRAAKFYLNGIETPNRTFPGQRVPLPTGVSTGCYLQVLTVEYSPKSLATVEHVCSK